MHSRRQAIRIAVGAAAALALPAVEAKSAVPPTDAELKAALDYFWTMYACRPDVSYVGTEVCRLMASREPTRVLKSHEEMRYDDSSGVRINIYPPFDSTWAQIADHCPADCCVVLERTDNELTFGYMECPE